MSSDATVEVAIADRVASVTLTGPPANALGAAMIDGLGAALDAAEEAGARVIVLRSALERYFAAGADLKLLGASDANGFAEYLDSLRRVIERLASGPQTSIAAIDGFALGGGLELALACTLRVATPRSSLGVPEIALGLLPGAGGTQRLPRLIGRGHALDLLLTGRRVGGDEAARIGLVDRLAPDGEAQATAAALAAALADGPQGALAATIRCVNAANLGDLADVLAVERAEILALFVSADAREGMRAFLEKRAPRFA